MKLQRYVSRELTHFVGRERPEEEQYKLLINIMSTGTLTYSREIFGKHTSKSMITNYGESFSENKMFNPGMVCFCDIPIEDLEIHMQKYSRFGISFLKRFLREKGANPVFYVARSAKNSGFGKESSLSEAYDDLLNQYHGYHQKLWEIIELEHPSKPAVTTDGRHFGRTVSKEFGDLMQFDSQMGALVWGYFKFFDDTKPEDDLDNYYMEREWRVHGDVNFSIEEVTRVILPESFSKKFRDDMPDFYGQLTFV